MRHVPSHTLMQSHQRVALKASLRTMLDDGLGERISGRPSALGVAADEAIHDLGYYIELGEPDAQLTRVATLAAQCAEGVFRVRGAYGPSRLQVGKETVSVANDANVSYATPMTWLSGFCAAALVREVRLLDRLCAVPHDVFSTTRLDDRGRAARPLFDALCAWWLGARDVEARVRQATSQIAVTGGPWGKEIYLPAAHALRRLVSGDVVGFNDALGDALRQHNRVCVREGSVLFGSPHGVLSPLLCALAAFAVDRDVPVEITSGYMPPIFVTGGERAGALQPGPRLHGLVGATDPAGDSLFIEAGETDLIEIVRLRNEDDIVSCDYRVLAADLDPEGAERMIAFEILIRHTSDYYRPIRDEVRYTNLDTGRAVVRRYP